jgi:hypothetical protein
MDIPPALAMAAILRPDNLALNPLRAPSSGRVRQKNGCMKYWIGGYIREARLKKGLSQTQLGGMVGCVQSYISMV